ncbi:hypothetical protein N7481_001508 [Penicillium waksmanii]|uniref:uncharacterized protein n=1 Tax=Penicillium waksmanii TaxID=69791 RepID=UPI002549A24D|nr:uncharacterized protein N7481_001508 [Penicillium waksmanii]KAJ6001099.1 hypothetical protein N7481_001508 [Penicillium waksmanii]
MVVPQRARFCAPLFNAVLSASARHFTTLPDYQQKEKTVRLGLQEDLIISEAAVLDYHNRCIAHLRLLADKPDAIMDENLLAAAVVLRFYEELDAPFIDLPTGAATRGLQVFIEAQASLALTSTGLRHAAFWIGFRQEFHMAFSQQRSFRLSLDICESYLSWDAVPDFISVNRLLIIAAHVLQYCYDDQDQTTYSRYEQVVSLRHRWMEERPLSFFPVYSNAPNKDRGEIFPRKWYLDNCHILAEQTVGLINILLTAYDPTIARVGPGQRRAMESIDAKLKLAVLDICGIAISNRQEPTALLTASIAIAICGDRFSDRTEQQALMDVVMNTIRDNNYWPSTALGAKLRKAWNWKS